jgi:hypothetical protein
LYSVPRILSTIDLAVVLSSFATHVSFHVRDVIELGCVAIFLHVGAFVLGHGGYEILDDFVGDKRMAEIEFRNVWLDNC